MFALRVTNYLWLRTWLNDRCWPSPRKHEWFMARFTIQKYSRMRPLSHSFESYERIRCWPRVFFTSLLRFFYCLTASCVSTVSKQSWIRMPLKRSLLKKNKVRSLLHDSIDFWLFLPLTLLMVRTLLDFDDAISWGLIADHATWKHPTLVLTSRVVRCPFRFRSNAPKLSARNWRSRFGTCRRTLPSMVLLWGSWFDRWRDRSLWILGAERVLFLHLQLSAGHVGVLLFHHDTLHSEFAKTTTISPKRPSRGWCRWYQCPCHWDTCWNLGGTIRHQSFRWSFPLLPWMSVCILCLCERCPVL